MRNYLVLTVLFVLAASVKADSTPSSTLPPGHYASEAATAFFPVGVDIKAAANDQFIFGAVVKYAGYSWNVEATLSWGQAEGGNVIFTGAGSVSRKFDEGTVCTFPYIMVTVYPYTDRIFIEYDGPSTLSTDIQGGVCGPAGPGKDFVNPEPYFPYIPPAAHK